MFTLFKWTPPYIVENDFLIHKLKGVLLIKKFQPLQLFNNTIVQSYSPIVK